MSHEEQLGFFSIVAADNAELVNGGRVFEAGSYDVNGSIRNLFGAAGEYIGADLVTGPGVDVVGSAHEIGHSDGHYDATVSGECFEHNPEWRATFQNMIRMTRPGGLVAFTCASRGRPEHGTARSTPFLSPGTQAEGLDYYQNLSAVDFERAMTLSEHFTDYRFWYIPNSFDLYFAGVRSGLTDGRLLARLPDSKAVSQLNSLATLRHKMVCVPLKALSRTSISEERYQDVVLPYWSRYVRLCIRVSSNRLWLAATGKDR